MKRRSLLLFVTLALLVFGGLAIYGDLPELLDRISSFPLSYWFIALGLALANYAVRLVRWHYYLRLLGINIGWVASMAVFMSGLAMAISPGKVGELAKSYFLKEKLDVPVARSAPVVITERFTDLLSVLVLSSWGLVLVPYGWTVVVLVLGVAATFVVLLVSPWGNERLLRLPLPSRWKPFLETSGDTFRQVFSLRPLSLALLLGALAWFAEGCALWVVLKGLDAPGSLGAAVSIYAAATLLGAITMLPGGLVGTEGGMVALLRQLDLTRPQASTATLIIRICTLWFAMAVGLIALAYVQLYMPRKPAQEEALHPGGLGAGGGPGADGGSP